MKQKDIALVVAVGIFSLVAALVLSNMLIGGSSKTQTAEVVEPITATFAQPDTKYFNANSIDPTELIRIGDNTNQAPFNQPATQ